MPRRSAAAMTVVPLPVDGKPTPLKPPADLGAREAILFKQLVASVDTSHFRASDLLLICRYVEAHASAERAVRQLRENGEVDTRGKISAWIAVLEKANRAIVALSTKLRLAPKSRIGPRDAHRLNVPSYPMPWRRDDDKEEPDA